MPNSYLVGLTIAPAFLSASIYLCLSRIIVIYGRTVSRLRPATYTITFISFDLFSLVLQAAGGAIAASTDDNSSQQAGINIMIAGLAFQVFSLFFFMCLCADFAFSAYRKQSSLDPAHATVRNSTKFKAFQLGMLPLALHIILLSGRNISTDSLLLALFAATILIFVRSCFRVAELKQGFDGKLANQEVTFMILEGAMIILAVTSLTIFHPGTCFQGSWNQANFSIRASKDRARAQNIESHEVNDYGKKPPTAASGTPSPA